MHQIIATPLRVAARLAALVGTAGSLALWVRAAQHPPLLIVVLFLLWVASPFGLLLLLELAAPRWPALVRTTLSGLMLVVAVGSLVVYGADAVHHRWGKAAFVYVVVPPVTWLLSALGLALAALVARRREGA